MDYKIWCTYHDKQLIKTHDLCETDNFKLFYTKDNLAGYSLNYAQLYLNEFVTQYYIWKNQIKSDYVGFCHYNRKIIMNDNIENELTNTGLYMHEYYQIEEKNLYYLFENVGLGYSCNILLDMFIKLNYYYLYDDYVKFKNRKSNYFAFRELYICDWDKFNNLMIFIDKFIKFIINNEDELYNIPIDTYNEVSQNLNDINFRIFENYHKCHKNDISAKKFYGHPRSIGFLIEHTIGTYLCYFMKNIKVINENS